MAKPKKNTPPVDDEATLPGETKAEKFVRIAPRRVDKAILAIRSLGKLGGPNYERTTAQVLNIMTALEDELANCKASLAPDNKSVAKTKSGFQL